MNRYLVILGNAPGGYVMMDGDEHIACYAKTRSGKTSTLVAETPELPLNLETILRIFARGDGIDWLINLINKRRAAGGRQYSQAAVDGVSDYISGADEQVEGIRKTVSTTLAPWYNPRI